MRVTQFSYVPSYGYRCSEPYDQSGEYVKADVARDLLAACKAYMDASGATNGRPDTDSPAEALMRAAIAKAEGRQP